MPLVTIKNCLNIEIGHVKLFQNFINNNNNNNNNIKLMEHGSI